MATKPPIISAFIDKLLAPIPAHEEQADTPKFRKFMLMINVAIWAKAMEAVEWAEATRKVVALEARNSPQGNMLLDSVISAFQFARAAEEAQCLVPAPTIRELRWKKRVTKDRDVSAEVAAAIAADEKRLA